MRVRTMLRLAVGCGVVVTAAIATDVRAAGRATVDVQVVGLEGELKQNVLSHLDIAAKRGRLSESEIRQLDGRAQKQIDAALQPYGYYRAAVRAELVPGPDQWIARYTIDPGPPIRIDSLDVQLLGAGASDPEIRRVFDQIPLHRGDVLQHVAYEKAKADLGAVAVRNGYIDAHFAEHEMRVDIARYGVAVVLHFDTGPRYVFGNVEFNQDVVDPELLRGYANFEPGQPVDYAKLIELERALGNSPYFARVEVEPRKDLGRANEVPIVVELVPSKPEKYTFGLGYGTDNGPHARGNVELRRLNRRGHRAEINGTVSAIEQSAAAKYEMPWPYPRTDVLSYRVGYSQIKTETADENSAVAGVGLARIWAGWQENFGLQFQRQKWEVALDHGTSDFLVPDASWARTRANDPIDPTDAARIRFHVSGADERVLSAASYVRLETAAKWIGARGKRDRLIGRVEAGRTWTKQFHELPPSVRFFAGGAQSVRGYSYNSLGPRDASGKVTGGSMYGLASVEYEHRFMPKWGGAVFYDIGNAVERFRDEFAQGTGVGVRWVSPVGMVRADLGVPLTGSGKHLQVHLSIGPGL